MKGNGAMSLLVLMFCLGAVLSHYQGVRAVRSPGGGENAVVAKRNNWWTKRALLPTAHVTPSSSVTGPIDRLLPNSVLDITALDFCERLGDFGRIREGASAQGGLRTVLLRPNVACVCAEAPVEDME